MQKKLKDTSVYTLQSPVLHEWLNSSLQCLVCTDRMNQADCYINSHFPFTIFFCNKKAVKWIGQYGVAIQRMNLIVWTNFEILLMCLKIRDSNDFSCFKITQQNSCRFSDILIKVGTVNKTWIIFVL